MLVMGTIERSGKAPQPTAAADVARSLLRPTTPKPDKSVCPLRTDHLAEIDADGRDQMVPAGGSLVVNATTRSITACLLPSMRAADAKPQGSTRAASGLAKEGPNNSSDSAMPRSG